MPKTTLLGGASNAADAAAAGEVVAVPDEVLAVLGDAATEPEPAPEPEAPEPEPEPAPAGDDPAGGVDAATAAGRRRPRRPASA